MIYIYIMAIALSTYLIRMLPLTLLQKKIESRFIRSFLYYVPYACLTAMTLPSIFSATRSVYSAVAGFLVAVIVAKKSNNLMLVAGLACLAVFIVEFFIV